ncbi:MAG: hypothetical protein NW241_15105 [Bacteroidia bacterium]|nr:hypothetical protein [Bacteroidia bacterium]
MTLLPNEQRILSSSNGRFILTDRRAILEGETFGQAYTIHCFLEDISAVEYAYTSNRIMLVFGVICIVLAPFTLAISLFGALIFFGVWWGTRKRAVRLTAHAGTTLDVLIDSLSTDKVNELLYAVLKYKEERVLYLFGRYPNSNTET